LAFEDAGGWSSNKIREAGETGSSNWPDFTLHRKARRNIPATEILEIIKTIITLME